MQNDLIPQFARRQTGNDEQKEYNRNDEGNPERRECPNIPAEGEHNAVEHRRNAKSGEKPHGRQQDLHDNHEHARKKDRNVIELYEPTRILAAPKDGGRNNAEQDTDPKATRLDLHHDGEKHDGKQKNLQDAVIYNDVHKHPSSLHEKTSTHARGGSYAEEWSERRDLNSRPLPLQTSLNDKRLISNNRNTTH